MNLKGAPAHITAACFRGLRSTKSWLPRFTMTLTFIVVKKIMIIGHHSSSSTTTIMISVVIIISSTPRRHNHMIVIFYHEPGHGKCAKYSLSTRKSRSVKILYLIPPCSLPSLVCFFQVIAFPLSSSHTSPRASDCSFPIIYVLSPCSFPIILLTRVYLLTERMSTTW